MTPEAPLDRYLSERETPSRPVMLSGKIGSRLIVAAPRLWPLLRRPARRIWNKQASRWDLGTKPHAVDHLAPLAAACERLESEPADILDVGTGTGAGAFLLARRFASAKVVGVDLATAMVAEASANKLLGAGDRISFAVADGASLPYDAESFDLVTHLNVPPFVDEVARVLRPGGHVILADSFGPATPSHVPARTIRRAFERRGIDVVASGEAYAGTFVVGRRRDG